MVQEMTEKQREDLKAEFPFLTPIQGSCDVRTTGKNIKAILKREHPEIKFSVRHCFFAAGDAFNISYASENLSSQSVKKIIEVFEKFGGTGWVTRRQVEVLPFQLTFGSAKYILVTNEQN